MWARDCHPAREFAVVANDVADDLAAKAGVGLASIERLQ